MIDIPFNRFPFLCHHHSSNFILGAYFHEFVCMCKKLSDIVKKRCAQKSLELCVPSQKKYVCLPSFVPTICGFALSGTVPVAYSSPRQFPICLDLKEKFPIRLWGKNQKLLLVSRMKLAHILTGKIFVGIYFIACQLNRIALCGKSEFIGKVVVIVIDANTSRLVKLISYMQVRAHIRPWNSRCKSERNSLWILDMIVISGKWLKLFHSSHNLGNVCHWQYC